MRFIARNTTLLLFLLFGSCFSGSAQTQVKTMLFDGLLRSYRLVVPASYNGTQQVPLVFNLHGAGSNAIQQELYSGMNTICDTAGFILVYPDGIANVWNSGFTPPYNGGVKDVDFLSAVIDTLMGQYLIDPARVYSCGMSNGGYMSYRLACDLEERIAAIASVTGSMTTTQTDNCQASRPVPVFQIHGTSDNTVAYNGSAAAISQDSLLSYWRSVNGCTGSPSTGSLPNTNVLDNCDIDFFHWNNCQAGTEVLHYRVNDGGHTWPGAFNVPLIGNTNQDIDASEEIWHFFLRHTHPNPLITSTNGPKPSAINISAGPNPFSETLKVETGTQAGTLILLDAQGKNIWQSELPAHSKFSIETAKLPAGLYFLHHLGPKGSQSLKLLHQ